MQKRGKKGLSTIVITLIIILISLVAVGIIWVVVRNVIRSGTEGITLGQFSLGAKITYVNVNDSSNNVSFIVERNAGEGEITGISFVFSSVNARTEVITRSVSLKELEQMKFNFHLENISVSNLASVSIFPLVNQNGQEVLGISLFKYNFVGNENNPIVQVCNPATCASLSYTCGTWANGSCSGTLNCGNCGGGLNCVGGACVCNPETCFSLGYTCGSGYANGTCGGTLSCGNCLGTNICVTGTCQPNPLCQKLVLLMHFDNNSAVGENNSFVYDWSGNGNRGRAFNNPRVNLTGGKYGGSFYFENKSDYIYLSGLSSKANISGTISFWLYYQQYETNDGFVVFDNPLAMATDSYTRLRFYKSTSPSFVQVGSNLPIPLSKWNLYTLTWNQTSARIYRNGTLDAETLAITLPYSNLVDGYIGSDRGIRSMNGSIDDLAIWNRTLTDAEILNLYSSGTAINC